MSIVRMKRLCMITMAEDCTRLMRALAKLGAVEISEPTEENSNMLFKAPETDEEQIRESLNLIVSAEEIVKRHCAIKKGMFSLRGQISEDKLFSSDLIVRALEAAETITEKDRELFSIYAEEGRLKAARENLVPWKDIKVPLDAPSGKYYSSMLCTAPSSVNIEEIKTAVYSASEYAELYTASTGRDLHYMFLIFCADVEEKLMEAVKPLGVSRVQFRGVKKTAAERISELDHRIAQLESSKKQITKELSETGECYDLLLEAHDALATRLDCEEASGRGRATERAIVLEGWFPAREEKRVSELLEKYGCAYKFSDPQEGEKPPTLTYNTKLVSPFGIITNMYSPPAYRGIDPNPFMAPFFALFFGIMLSDAGYGLLLAAAGIFALWKLNPRGGFKNFMQLAVICGISTIIWGLLFGGVFGDAIPSIYKLFTGKEFAWQMALWFDPTEDPMKMLIFSLILGGIQIVSGMAVKAYMMIRDGEVWSAVFDIGFWWVLFAGLVIALLGNSQAGLTVSAVGAVGLILTQGRAKKGIVMKFFGGLISLYDITSYFSDLLSYSRLLALSLSTAVVASVINTMGMLTGVIGFFIVFIIGHVFNIAINLIGSFVHSARLQYVEYFGKFYESGGVIFNPLTIKTKNVDIIKEEK